MMDTDNSTVAQKISLEEYEKQKTDYTQKALKELRLQMNTEYSKYENPKKKIKKNSIDEDQEDSYESNESNESNDINIIIHREEKPKLRQRKINNYNSNDSQLLEKYDKSMKTIQDLKLLNSELEDEITTLDKKIHYMKLDLTNITVDFADLQEKYIKLINENNTLKEKLENEHKKYHKNKFLQNIIYSFIVIVFILMFLGYSIK